MVGVIHIIQYTVGGYCFIRCKVKKDLYEVKTNSNDCNLTIQYIYKCKQPSSKGNDFPLHQISFAS